MAASDLHSDLSTSSSLGLALESLAISSPAEKLQERDPGELRSAYDCSSSSSSSGEEEDPHQVRKSPFHVFYLGEDDGSSSLCTHRLGCNSTASVDANCSCGESSDPSWSSGSPSIASPQDGASRSKREALLSEAWERKRKLMLREELSNLKDCAQPGLLGRSVSCVKPMKDTSSLLNCKKLDRSVSDCSIPSNSVWGARTRSLTDHDFEELKGFIDLGFHFDESSIPDLCNTLPALEVCCAVSQNFQGSPHSTSQTSSATGSLTQSLTPSPTPSWTIASPGDDPEVIKERLRHWARAVACSTRLCY